MAPSERAVSPAQRIGRLLEVAERLAPMGSWDLDLRTGDTVWTDGLYRMLGLPPRDLPRDEVQILDIVHPRDRERLRGTLRAVAGRPSAVPPDGIEFELDLLRADGSVCQVRALGHVALDDDDRPAHWFGLVLDLTAQRAVAPALRGHLALAEAVRAWKQMELGTAELIGRVALALDQVMAFLWLWDERSGALVEQASWTAPCVDARDAAAVRDAVAVAAVQGGPGVALPTCGPRVTLDVAAAPAVRCGTSAVAFRTQGPVGAVAVLGVHAREKQAGDAELACLLTAVARELAPFVLRRRIGTRPLTRRELQILRLAAEGMRGPAIASTLVLSPSTVKTHFFHIYEKLGVPDRAGAVAQALRLGLLD
jgi:DNA-binding CsgD family transcriptional regulator